MSINPVNSNYYNYDYKINTKNNKQVKGNNLLLNNSYTTDSVSFSFNKASTSSTSTDVSALKKDLQKTKSEQGVIGKLWDGFKNLTGIGAGSNKAEKAIEDFESGKISEEEMLKKVNGYKEGQKTCVDVVADVASGLLAVGAFALAVPTGGASLAVGLGLATAVGAGVKIGLKAGDAAVGGREYSGKDLLYDAATGAINGVLAPVTNGLGNTVTKTIGQKFGLKIVKEGAEEVAEHAVKQGLKQGFKSAVLNQSTDVVGGSIAKRAIATGAGMAVDGALGGAGDNMVRAALNGENVFKAGVEGAIGGLIMAPIIGGGFRVAGKAGRALNGKITMSKVLPDGINTKFKQGSVGDCALLSTIDGMLNNPATAKNLKKSITKTIGGDYNVQIGDKIVKVAKSSLTDEMLSDTTGIKIFEQAYKKLNGSIDGGFAEVVAKQFGLNPVHIANESITDELLDTLAKNQGDSVLSLGALVDADGAISNVNGQRHYFTIKNIDADSKMVTLTSPTDTSKAIELSYDDIKNLGISIDGGTIKDIGLPYSVRNIDDEMFRGVQTEQNVISEFDLANYDYDSEYKLTDFSDELYIFVDDKEIPLGKYRKLFKKLKNNPNDNIVITDSLKNEMFWVYGDGRIVNVSDSGDLHVRIGEKSTSVVLDNIDVIRKSLSDKVDTKQYLPKEEILKFFFDITDSKTYNQLKNLSEEDLNVFYNCFGYSNKAIDGYKGDMDLFKKIQKSLDNNKNGVSLDKNIVSTIDSISTEIEQHIVPDGTELYRGTGYAEFGDIGIEMESIDSILSDEKRIQAINNFLLTHNDEYVLDYPRFMSTNIGDFAGNFSDADILMTLVTENNSRGLSIIDNRYSGKELEILLQRDSKTRFYVDYDFAKNKWLIRGRISS